MSIDQRLKPNYEPFEFRDSPELEDYVEEEKRKYGINLEKFYSRQHFEEFWKLIQGANLRERLWTWGTFAASWGSFMYLTIKLIPYFNDGLVGGLEFLAGFYGSGLGAVAIADNLIPFYEKISSKMFNKNYRQYCEDNNIPYDTI